MAYREREREGEANPYYSGNSEGKKESVHWFPFSPLHLANLFFYGTTHTFHAY